MKTTTRRRGGYKPALMACAAGVSLLASPALAQERRVDGEKILELLVARGVISKSDADTIISQAEVVPAPAPIQGGVAADGTQTIPYVPQVVRDQITEQVKSQLASQAQAEGWSKPGETPEWTRRISLYGDVRARYEGVFMDKDNSDNFPNFGAINAGEPQNVNDTMPGYVEPAFINTLENRTRFQLRARLGLKAQIADWVSADVRIATGNDRTPVSTNQTLGAFGGGGYAIWLDRASLHLTPVKGAAIDLGRFSNPFWTSELLFDQDLNFDGIAVSGRGNIGERFALFGTAGAFPIFNTDLNFVSRNAKEFEGAAFKSQDRYLFAAQAGFDFKATEQVNVRLAGGYFHFDNVAGKVANCYYYQVVCASDAMRPAFQQFGNTMMTLRNTLYDGAPDPTVLPDNQYFGLASKFEVLNVHGAIDFKPSERFGVRLEGDFVKNLGWNRSRLRGSLVEGVGYNGIAVNNLGEQIEVLDLGTTDPDDVKKVDGPYTGGDTGWQVRLAIGSALDAGQGNILGAKRGDWNAWLSYRRLESDAVLDAFADSDFHIGGTNNRGWQLGGNYAIAPNTLIGARWMSAEEIADAPFSVDRLFVDMSVRF
ncbi:putative porin [Sandaracinobacter sp. RS1-74]|uniref:putative porin n=1 Tax=Sandaracinobacteroides sayramensis TaxID=2913411 RepID=UPI001EDBADDD|nr:putative porin [Sandaracinobacteroides sayramensis]MCG2841226.1 putative porin [Sandaracinobacteroides sayramensis]